MTERKVSNKLRDKFSHFRSSPYVFGTSKKNVNTIFKSKFGGQIWAAAKASSQIKHDEAMAIIVAINCDAAEYLKNADPKRWARSHFPVPRFGTVTLNSAKSLNSWMKEYRDKSHLGILEIQIGGPGSKRTRVCNVVCINCGGNHYRKTPCRVPIID
ncbi:hypothetical protein BASA50_006258 [Batrachochytrium salamandrivorans]|uniref:Uncharacterized protein n=1 Tax=Batrachochytrium salamandrivorans TaxID=1357716 RepID=A0ABQ8FAZ8_9FUNG|nr:hypothetical protein BASA50_006252 [Batrachochytrium salamandrivorans]KAH6594906.1 hypothetical protein BASA50_006258 [Batrachochytrium salamandrivorans]KAH6601968.1 hypothetical protein BASA61_001610 [Batrachochytrium salamandrivorans]